MTGIKPQELEIAPEFGQIYPEVKKRLEGAVFVAHNVRFDFAFVKSEFARLDQRVWWPQLCTVRLSRTLFPTERRHGLDALIDRFGISCQQRHRALGDALATYEFYRQLFDRFPAETVATAVSGIIKQPALPPALAGSDLERLPQESGVYLFYGENNELLYVGKSINLRDRVWSHFYRDGESPRELILKNQVNRIETIVTTGELEALMLEARLVKDRQPLFNRRLRRLQEIWCLKLDQTQTPHQVMIEKSGNLDNQQMKTVIGIGRRKNILVNQLTALAEKYQLCRRQLGLERTSGPCFAYHIDGCRGICAGKETPESFNLRLLQALAEIKLPSWPFEGPIGISEVNLVDGSQKVHVFDQWCYLGDVSVENLADRPVAGAFDIDLYHILRRWLKNHSPSQVMKL
jgi:DNA polymerase-3 subunit epsilon